MKTVRTLLRILLVLLIVVVLVLGGVTGYAVYTTRRMLPQHSGALALAGLDGTVEILRDAAGIPHIYANSSRDLFFAQGVVHAQDRWWQMEFNRHIAMGRIGELTGYNERVRRNDIFIRTVGWNRSAEADLTVLTDTDRKVLQDYADGINAYIGGKSGADLAVEYSLLALNGVTIPIEPWLPLHTAGWANVMAWDLGGNIDEELDNVNIFEKLGANAEAMYKGLVPDYPYESRPTSVTKDDLPIDAQPVDKTVAALPLIAPGTDLRSVETQLVGGLTRDELLVQHSPGLGSNNWVIGGGRTVTGKPMLANDMHLSIQMPSIWYQIGLHCVTVSAACPYDVVGYTFPGIPGVVVGHNQHIAWGVTNLQPDTQDLYIMKLDPTDPNKYLIDDQPQAFQIVEETIKYGDGKPAETIKVRISRFGPLITDTPSYSDQKSPLALRWLSMQEPKHLMTALLGINRATDWQSFRTALQYWDAAQQNFIYADTEGNIGYQMPGKSVIRAAGHSGLTPVDGSTMKYDWKGFVPFELLPRAFNPARGYIATANHTIVTPEYYDQLAEKLGDQYGKDSNYRIHVIYTYGNRAQRINDLIAATDKHSIDTISKIHGDNYNWAGAAVIPSLLKVQLGSDIPADVIDWLRGWDFQNDMKSGQAALFEAFWVELVKGLWGDELGYTPSNGGGALTIAVEGLLTDPTNKWWDDVTTANVTETRDDILQRSLIKAYKDLSTKYGADIKQWAWGKLHTATFVSNPVGNSSISVLRDFVNAGPVAVSGGPDIVNASSYRMGESFDVTSIPSERVIVDLANFDASVWINTTGQSGHPVSPNYRDQIEKWRNIQYDPMPYTRAAVEKRAVNTLKLEPKR